MSFFQGLNLSPWELFVTHDSKDTIVYRNLNNYSYIFVCYDKLLIKFSNDILTSVSRNSLHLDTRNIKKFSDRESMDKFIKKYLENHHESENIKELQCEMKDLKIDIGKINTSIEEIKEMIKYIAGSQMYTEANKDFIAQQKN